MPYFILEFETKKDILVHVLGLKMWMIDSNTS